MSGVYYIRASGCTDDNDSCRPCLRDLNREQERYKQLYNDTLDCLDEKCRELAELRKEHKRFREALEYIEDMPLDAPNLDIAMQQIAREVLERPA